MVTTDRLRWRTPDGFRSVRARTTLLASTVVGLTLVAGAASLLLTLDHSLSSNRDEVSHAQVLDLAGQIRSGTAPRLVTNLGANSVAQAFLRSGRVLAASSGLIGKGPILPAIPANSTPHLVTLHNVPDDSDREVYRAWVMRVDLQHGPAAVIVGASPEAVSEAVATLRGALFIGVPLLLGLLAVSTYVMIGRALRPVEDIRTQVATITDSELKRRVPVPPEGDEITRLAETMNDMLDRLETSSSRQREFVADASHELQSPLAAFRTQLEVALAHPDGVDWSPVAAGLLVDTDRMERLVADLLFLAHGDATSPRPRRDPVDLDVVVLEEAARLRTSQDAEIDTSGVSGAAVRGSRDELSRLVRNLMENATSHAHARVMLTLCTTPTEVQLTVTDDGQGISADDSERIFDRFTRIEGARVRATSGTGLGLSIARSIAERHGGTLTLRCNASPWETGAEFLVVLPPLQ